MGRVARMTVGPRSALALAGTLTAPGSAFGIETAALLIAEAVAAATLAAGTTLFAIRTSAAPWTAGAAWTRRTGTRARTSARLAGVRFLGTTWASIAMTGRAGVHALGHIPTTECGWIAIR
jgi:hypothetical protein